jgi:histidine triad (HIT) family protein
MDRSLLIYLYSRFSRLKSKMVDSCIFCKIARKEVKSTILYQDDQVTAFRDTHPVAPTHILIIPNKHIESLNELMDEDKKLIGHMFIIARQLAAQEGIHEGGYRVIVNTGPDGGQTVFHLHLHLIGGQHMKHPLG